MSNNQEEFRIDKDWDEEALASSPTPSSNPRDEIPEVFRPSFQQVFCEFVGALGELANLTDSLEHFERTKEALETSFSRLMVALEERRPRSTAAGDSTSGSLPQTASDSTSGTRPGASQGQGQARIEGDQAIRSQSIPVSTIEVQQPPPTPTPLTIPVDRYQNLIRVRREAEPQDEGRMDVDSREGWEPVTIRPPRTPPPGCDSDDDW